MKAAFLFAVDFLVPLVGIAGRPRGWRRRLLVHRWQMRPLFRNHNALSPQMGRLSPVLKQHLHR